MTDTFSDQHQLAKYNQQKILWILIKFSDLKKKYSFIVLVYKHGELAQLYEGCLFLPIMLLMKQALYPKATTPG